MKFICTATGAYSPQLWRRLNRDGHNIWMQTKNLQLTLSSQLKLFLNLCCQKLLFVEELFVTLLTRNLIWSIFDVLDGCFVQSNTESEMKMKIVKLVHPCFKKLLSWFSPLLGKWKYNLQILQATAIFCSGCYHGDERTGWWCGNQARWYLMTVVGPVMRAALDLREP